MNTKHLLTIFTIAAFCTSFLTSCSEEEELPEILGSWQVNEANASADFDEAQFVSALVEQGLSEDVSNEILLEFKEDLIEVQDLDQVTIVHEFKSDDTYTTRSEFENEDYPDQEQNGTYVFNRKTRELVFSPIDDPISNDPISYTVETLSESDLVLLGNFEIISHFGRDAIDVEILVTVTTSVTMTRL